MKRGRVVIPLLIIFVFLRSGGLSAQPVQPPESLCQNPPAGARPLPYQVLFVEHLGGTPDEPIPDPAPPPPAWNLQDREEIRSERDYQRIFGTASVGIDWETTRIVVVQELTVYRGREIESTYSLSGAYQTDDMIFIRMSSAHNGPCQGIAQRPEWFSFKHTIMFILLPARPENIFYYTCSTGGCPPDIP